MTSMKNYASNSQFGFTLIEAMIVTMVIAIVASFAAPAFQNVIKNQRMQGVTNEIVSTLQTARSEAVKRSTRVTVCFKIYSTGNQCQNLGGAADRTNYIYAFVDNDNDQVFDTTEELLYLSNKFSDQVLYKHPSNSGLRVRKSISFDARGNASFGLPGDTINRSQREGLIGLCDDRNDNSVGRAIRLGVTGRVQVSEIRSSDGITC